MIMYHRLRRFIKISLIMVGIVAGASLVQAGDASASGGLTNKDVIMVLFGLLQTVFCGIGVWLIANDKELFTRVGKAETAIEVQSTRCEERWDAGSHPQRREGERK